MELSTITAEQWVRQFNLTSYELDRLDGVEREAKAIALLAAEVSKLRATLQGIGRIANSY